MCQCVMVNMSAKFDKETCNGVVSMVFTMSAHGRTEPQQCYYIPTATRCAGIIKRPLLENQDGRPGLCSCGTKFGRKQESNVLCQVCVCRANQKAKLDALVSSRDIFLPPKLLKAIQRYLTIKILMSSTKFA